MTARVWQLYGHKTIVFVFINPKIEESEIERIQKVILDYIGLIGRVASAGAIKATGEKDTCFEIMSPLPWDGFTSAVEVGLSKALGIPRAQLLARAP